MIGTLDGMATKDRNSDETQEGKRLRLIVDVDDDKLSAAVQLRASKLSVIRKRRVSKSEVVADILRRDLAEELADIDKYEANEPPPKGRPAPSSTRRRTPPPAKE